MKLAMDCLKTTAQQMLRAVRGISELHPGQYQDLSTIHGCFVELTLDIPDQVGAVLCRVRQ